MRKKILGHPERRDVKRHEVEGSSRVGRFLHSPSPRRIGRNDDFNYSFFQSGFTLLELIIVMVIISALAVGLWSNFMTSVMKGKDSKRKQDLDSVSRAMEIYYADHNAYPSPPFALWGQEFVNSDNPTVIYMSKVPSDPANPASTYCYSSDDFGSYFKLYANLDNKNDSAVFPTPVQCGTKDYNYGISSSNTSP